MTGIGSLMPVKRGDGDRARHESASQALRNSVEPFAGQFGALYADGARAAKEMNVEILEGSVDNTAAVAEVTIRWSRAGRM